MLTWKCLRRHRNLFAQLQSARLQLAGWKSRGIFESNLKARKKIQVHPSLSSIKLLWVVETGIWTSWFHWPNRKVSAQTAPLTYCLNLDFQVIWKSIVSKAAIRKRHSPLALKNSKGPQRKQSTGLRSKKLLMRSDTKGKTARGRYRFQGLDSASVPLLRKMHEKLARSGWRSLTSSSKRSCLYRRHSSKQRTRQKRRVGNW